MASGGMKNYFYTLIHLVTHRRKKSQSRRQVLRKLVKSVCTEPAILNVFLLAESFAILLLSAKNTAAGLLNHRLRIML